MFDFVKEIYRKRALRRLPVIARNAGFLPLNEIHSICYLLPLPQNDVLGTMKELNRIAKENNTSLCGIALSTTKESQELVVGFGVIYLTSENFNFYGLPQWECIHELITKSYDLFIDFSVGSDFSSDYISKLINARFKIGKSDYIGNSCDFIVEMEDKKDNIAFIRSVFKYISSINNSQ